MSVKYGSNTWIFNAKIFYDSSISNSDENCFSVGATESNIGSIFSFSFYCFQKSSFRRYFPDFTDAPSSNIKIPKRVTSHSISKSAIFKGPKNCALTETVAYDSCLNLNHDGRSHFKMTLAVESKTFI